MVEPVAPVCLDDRGGAGQGGLLERHREREGGPDPRERPSEGFEYRAAYALRLERRGAGDHAGQPARPAQAVLEDDGAAEAVAVEEDRRAGRLPSPDVVEAGGEIVAVVGPGVDVAAPARRATVAAQVEAVHREAASGQRRDDCAVAPGVLAEAVDDGHRGPRGGLAVGSPAVGHELDAPGAAEGGVDRLHRRRVRAVAAACRGTMQA